MFRRCVLISFLGCGLGCGGGGSSQPLQVGHVATLSGPDREAGDQALFGLALALKEKDVGAVQGRPVLIRHTDARGHLDNFEGEAVRLVSVHRVVALYGGTTVAETRRLARAGIPVLTPCGLRPLGDHESVFALGLSPQTRGAVLAQFIKGDLKASAAALVYEDQDDECRAIADEFTRAFAGANLERLPWPQEADPAAWERRLNDLAAPIVVMALPPHKMRRAARQLPKKTLLLGASLAHLGHWDREGTYALSAFVSDPALPMSLEFAQSFTKAQQKPPDEQAALAYDGLRLFSHCLGKCQPLTLDNLLKELRGLTDFPGLNGPLRFGPDQTLRRPAFVVRHESHQWKLVKRFDSVYK